MSFFSIEYNILLLADLFKSCFALFPPCGCSSLIKVEADLALSLRCFIFAKSPADDIGAAVRDSLRWMCLL